MSDVNTTGNLSKRAFITWGGWNGHEPQQTSTIFGDVLRKLGYEVIIEDSLEPLANSDFMRSLDIVIPVWTMSSINREEEAGLLNAIRNGTGCAGWHGGMGDSFRNNVEYQFMVGGQFICHPGGIIDYDVNIEVEDPIVEGLSDFSMKSEQYFMHVDPSVEVLATTTFSGSYWGIDWVKDVKMPVCWKKCYGQGKVFYSSLGHVASDFDVPEAKEIMKRGMIWATR
ncbi:MAG: ThuA domain-containing protein [Gammaproteobacteria bacterium]|nr:ThuA domain-containing protein [Gammaproteobacteria bacterium]